MNQHIPDREPERRPLPGPWTDAGVLDAYQLYVDERAYFEEMQSMKPVLGPGFYAVDDDGEHGASETITRWENDRMAGIE